MCLKVGLWRIDLKDFFLCPLFPFSPRGIIDSDKKCSSDTKAIVSKGYHSLYILQERNIVHTQEKYFQQKMFDRTNKSQIRNKIMFGFSDRPIVLTIIFQDHFEF